MKSSLARRSRTSPISKRAYGGSGHHGCNDRAATLAQYARDDDDILDCIGRWLERDVRPHVHALEHDDIYPHEMVEQMKALGLFGATIAPDYGGLGLSATTYARIVQRVSEVWMSLTGIFNSHLIMAACIQRVGTEEQKQRYLPRHGERRDARRPGAHRAGLRHRPAGDPHARGARRRPLRRQRHQDLDLQRHPRPRLRAAGQDRSGRRAAPPRHEHAGRREGAGLHGVAQAREDRLQGHRLRRARVPGLPSCRPPP